MKKYTINNAWLSPTGKLVTDHKNFDPFGGAWHENLAMCIIQDMYKLKYPWDVDLYLKENKGKRIGTYMYEYLEDLGWIRLHGFGGRVPTWIIPYDKKPTKKQEKVMADWCIDNETNWNLSVEEN